MKKFLTIFSLFCFTTLAVNSYAGGTDKKEESKPACCAKGAHEGKACCAGKDAKTCAEGTNKNCSKDAAGQKSCNGNKAETKPEPKKTN